MKKPDKKTIFTIVWMILAAVCLGYGIMVRAVGSGTGFFMVWLGLGILCILIAAANRRDLWKRAPDLIRMFITLVVIIGTGCFVVVEGGIISGFYQHGQPDLDYIIVLGAQVYESGPSAVLKFRLDEAIEYLNDNPDTICIVSGGQGYNEPFAEAEGMADYLEKNGIPENRILVEDQSTTTEENIKNSMALMDENASVGIVTNNFHVFRAVQTAQELGIKQVCGIAADSTKLFLPNNMLREFFGEMKFLVLEMIQDMRR